MKLRETTEFVGGPDDGRVIPMHCSQSEKRVQTATLPWVFSVYEEENGKLVFQGYRSPMTLVIPNL